MYLDKFSWSGSCVGLLALALVTNSASATILTFENNSGGGGLPSLLTYGDNVTVSPDANSHVYGGVDNPTGNIALDFSAGWYPAAGPDLHWSSNVLRNTDDDLTIIFTPDPGYGVTLHSFVRDSYYDPNSALYPWEVRKDTASGDILASGSADGTGEILVSPEVTYMGTLVFVAKLEGNTTAAGNVALDDITFSQVPEPMSASMMMLMGGAMMRWRGR